MEIKECIEQGKKFGVGGLLSKEALDKLITIAEQVERVEGIIDTCPIVLALDKRLECDGCRTDRMCFGYCKHKIKNIQNSQWRALIVGRVTSVEKCIKPIVEKIWQEGFDGYNNVDKNIVELSTVICSLFLGEKDV